MATAFVTDSRFAAHTLSGHPEYAERLVAIQRRLDEEALTARFHTVAAVPATEEDLLAIHVSDYLTLLQQLSRQPSGVMLGPDTYVMPGSYEIAQLAAGGVLRVVDAVMQGATDNGMAAIRPPGHHATSSRGMGFCLLNNVAIAARYIQRVYGVERVLIVDYDVHHGNGTQDIFYDDASVLYVSTHQSPLYPGTGGVRETGSGAGEGYTLNIPLPAGVGDEGYVRVFGELIEPTARRFGPEVLLVSAGFDAHWVDPLANMRLSLTGYDRITRSLLALADQLCAGRVVVLLEGGYDLGALSHGWANVARALLGDSHRADPLGPSRGSEPSIDQLVIRIKQLHKLA